MMQRIPQGVTYHTLFSRVAIFFFVTTVPRKKKKRDKNQIRTVCKDPEEQAKAEAKLRAEDEAKQLRSLSRAVGFRRVMDEIFKAGKPVVCHNGLLVRRRRRFVLFFSFWRTGRDSGGNSAHQQGERKQHTTFTAFALVSSYVVSCVMCGSIVRLLWSMYPFSSWLGSFVSWC